MLAPYEPLTGNDAVATCALSIIDEFRRAQPSVKRILTHRLPDNVPVDERESLHREFIWTLIHEAAHYVIGNMLCGDELGVLYASFHASVRSAELVDDGTITLGQATMYYEEKRESTSLDVLPEVFTLLVGQVIDDLAGGCNFAKHGSRYIEGHDFDVARTLLQSIGMFDTASRFAAWEATCALLMHCREIIIEYTLAALRNSEEGVAFYSSDDEDEVALDLRQRTVDARGRALTTDETRELALMLGHSANEPVIDVNATKAWGFCLLEVMKLFEERR